MKTYYTYCIVDLYGPFCGMGGYYSFQAVGMARSPKKAIELANKHLRKLRKDHSEKVFQGNADEGVPVLYEEGFKK